MLTLDVTGDKWMCVDMECSDLSFLPPPLAVDRVEMQYRDLILRFAGEPAIAAALGVPLGKGGCRLSGWSRVTFTGVVAMELRAALYDGEGTSFLKDANNKTIVLERSWGATRDAREYEGGGALDWPFADCGVTIWAHDHVWLIVDPLSIEPW